MGDSGNAHVSRLALSPGVLIASKYELVAPLGCGAMGEVWKARHVTLHEDVAVKLVGWTEEHRDGAELASRFHLEARLAAGLSRKSRHIVSVTDHGIQKDEGRGEALAYLVMEELIGEPLDERLERTGPMAVPEVVAIVTQMARGLTVAHAEGVIHRDLKPGNVFLAHGADGEQDVVKILDFGIAKFRAGDERRAYVVNHQTQRGLLLGTLPYVSPEQARGWVSLDHRADVWSLAVITYLLLTNEYPFGGATPSDLLARIFSGQYVPVHERRDLPPMFADLFAKAFDRHLDMRFQSATDFANALALASEAKAHAFPHPPSGAVPPPGAVTPAKRRVRSRLVLGATIALFVAGTSAALVRAAARRDTEPTRSSEANARSSASSVGMTTTAPALSTTPSETVAEPPLAEPPSPSAPSATRRPRRAAPTPPPLPSDRSKIF
ncbi:MAG: serine/threonine protein kinase [Labilithrix sp.]|nr:serine/threonine protein kinase [Labilithrix sp.]